MNTNIKEEHNYNIIMETQNTKISIFEKSAYGLGDMASNLFYQTFTMFLLYFYTDVFGISAAAAGTMFLAVRMLDTFYDPLVGAFADRTRSKYGKFRPWILYTVVPFGVIGFMTFYTPDLAASSKLVYAYVTYTAMMFIYSTINVPYGALMAVMTPNSLERTSLSAFRSISAFIGGLIVQGLTLKLVHYFGLLKINADGSVNEQFGFSVAMGIYSVLAVVMFLTTFFVCKERVTPVNDAKNSLKEDIKDLFKNVPWLILTVVGIMTCLYVAIRNGSIIYYFKYYANNSGSANLFGFEVGADTLISTFMVVGTGFSILGTILLKPMAAWIGKKRVYMLSMLLGTILSMAYYFLDKDQISLMFLFQALCNFAVGPAMAMMWSMYADTADYSEWKTGRRATGLIYSSANFAQKFGWSIGGAIAGYLLAYFGFVANAAVTSETEKGVRILFSFMPAIWSLIAVIALLFYSLDEQKVIEINKTLDELKKRNSEP
ncbi:MAG: MFS transporter [Bacteroidales bacterium]|nr:MFS transporter [Bacteroidales bacterium]